MHNGVFSWDSFDACKGRGTEKGVSGAKMKLVEFIKQNSEWEKKLSEMSVRVKRNGSLMIFNYLPGADFFNEIVRECRGVILDSDLNVVCTGFDKFGNFTEPYAADIDWSTAKVQQKLDGSIVKLYWYDGKWNWATNSCIFAKDAEIPNEYKNYQNLIDRAENLPDTAILDKKNTYIFELVSPFNRVVIEYPKTRLYHIGTRENDIFRKEICVNIGVDKPKEYPLHSLEACVEAVKHLNGGENVTDEGFVVCDSQYNRVKIKAPEYFELHRRKFTVITPEIAIGLLQNMTYEEAVSEYPGAEVELAWYLYQYNLFLREKKRMETYAVNLYNEYEQNRKLVADEIKNDSYAYFGFIAINGKPVEEVEWKIMKNYIRKPVVTNGRKEENKCTEL